MHRDSPDLSAARHRRRTDGARILVIEDSDDLRALMEFTLEHEGYLVDAVPSAEDAMRMLETRTYRLVLSDYALPGRSGVWLLSEALERGLLRGAATRLVTADPDASGITPELHVVPKPVDFELFLPQVRAILASRADDGGEPPVERARDDGTIELVLYVSPASLPCVRATRLMHQLLRHYDEAHLRFTICDVAADPQQAARDHVVFTPSLVKRRPAPRLWIVGNIEHAEVVTDMLGACGAREKAR